MAATELNVATVPFQGYLDLAATGNMIAVPSSLECTFVNNGNTILVVENNAVATNLVTITAVPDNAGRSTNISFAVPAIAGGVSNVTLFGALRPVWWNYGGVVRVTFANNTTIRVGAINIQF